MKVTRLRRVKIMMNKQYCPVESDGHYPGRTVRNFRRVHHPDRDFLKKTSQVNSQAVVRFFRTTAADQHVCATTTRDRQPTCKQNLQVQHKHARQEYERFAQRRREHMESLGEVESIKALEEAAKKIEKPGGGE